MALGRPFEPSLDWRVRSEVWNARDDVDDTDACDAYQFDVYTLN